MARIVAIVKGAALAAAAVAGASALAGCSTTSNGGASLASLSMPASGGAPVAPVDAAPLPVPVNYGGFLGGSVGMKLPEADRKSALAAEDGAVASGERRSWKGDHGVYGFVTPGPTSAAPTALRPNAAASHRPSSSAAARRPAREPAAATSTGTGT
jgi:surface antigen